MNRERVLGDALDRNDRQMPAPAEEADVEVELDSRLPADESAWGCARGAPWPSRSGLEPRRPACWTPMVVNLVRGCGAEARMRPAAVVPSEVETEFLVEIGETVWNRDQPSRALGLECPDAPLDHGEAAVLTDSAEALADAAATAPSSELLGDELPALIRDEIPWLVAHLREESLQESANGK